MGAGQKESGSAGWARCYKVGRPHWQGLARALASPPAGLALRRAAGQRSSITDRKAKIGEAMRAIRIHQTGGPEVMRLEEVELPPPGKSEVRLRITSGPPV